MIVDRYPGQDELNVHDPEKGRFDEDGHGGAAVFSCGWTGSWQIHDTIRKL